ncbi:NAD(P)-binding protein [Microthyrium microscopicum]|uniref:NAD(P)-binding protein n=1 Tax=Microthyrium microscopicum TaxID=703497 RepID=A0A6A6U7P7_9PEZI|nr:NAD(P)-binding protein [Microthyrium microscopicum]
MLVIVGASGKIGGASLSSLITEKLVPTDEIVCTTSAAPDSAKWKGLAEKGVQVRHATFDDPGSMETAFAGCDKLFLVSSPRIKMDFFDAPYGSGREKDHFVALEAAKKAGVKHIFYTSLAFANPSKSNVMTAHERTEERLHEMEKEGMKVTILREGLYNESWPLYFGHYNATGDDRSQVIIAGDGKISWTAIADLGYATASIIAAPAEYEGKTVYLSSTSGAKSLQDIAEIVSKEKGSDIKLEFVTRSEHEAFYIDDKKMDEGQVRWWAATYDALNDEECFIKDQTFEKIMETRGRKPKPVEDTIREMLH